MQMKTGFLSQIHKVEVKEFDIPEFDQQSVLVKVNSAGVCGSDLHAFHGTHPFRKPPMILGHEASGEVVQLGRKVKGLKVGDRIAVEPLKLCGKCEHCRSGRYNLCRERTAAGLRGWMGTFAEYFVIQEEHAHKLPKTLDYDTAVLAEPLAVSAHAVRIAHMKRGSVCVVLGGGTIGLLAGVAAQAAGAKPVYCTDINRYRLELAGALGLVPIKADEVPVQETVRSFAPNGADVVLVAFTSPHVLNQALRLVKRGGTIIVIALFTEPITFDMNLLQEEVELKGSIYYTGEDFKTAIKILEKRTADLRKLITHHVDLEGVHSALEMLADPNTMAVKIIVHP